MLLAALSVTVNVNSALAAPSVAGWAVIEMVGGSSSSVMVPVPVKVVASTALVGLLRVTYTVSLSSSVLSPSTVTLMLLLVSPAANVREPAVRAV